MGKELTIRSDEAISIANDLAQRLDRSVEEVVEAALRRYLDTCPPPPVEESEEERAAFIEKIRALSARAREELRGQPPLDIDALLYDEHGLPR